MRYDAKLWAFRKTPDRGRQFNRLKGNNPREVGFAQEWDKENDSDQSICRNYGCGILQDLFIEAKGMFWGRRMTHRISNRERMIVATVIQWLGSNCGMCFLEQALKRSGYKIVRIKDTSE